MLPRHRPPIQVNRHDKDCFPSNSDFDAESLTSLLAWDVPPAVPTTNNNRNPTLWFGHHPILLSCNKHLSPWHSKWHILHLSIRFKINMNTLEIWPLLTNAKCVILNVTDSIYLSHISDEGVGPVSDLAAPCSTFSYYKVHGRIFDKVHNKLLTPLSNAVIYGCPHSYLIT